MNRIRQVRETFHINQSELARRIGVTSQLISQMESGKMQISNMTARAIESEFGVNHQWLLTGEGQMLPDRPNMPERYVLCPELITALNYYPAVVEALNNWAKKLTLADWEALNIFLTRNNE